MPKKERDKSWDELKEKLSKSKKPKTVSSYITHIQNLYKKLFGSNVYNFKKIEKIDDIIKYIENLPPNDKIPVFNSIKAVIFVENREDLFDVYDNFSKIIGDEVIHANFIRPATEKEKQNYISLTVLKNNANKKRNKITGATNMDLIITLIALIYTKIPLSQKELLEMELRARKAIPTTETNNIANLGDGYFYINTRTKNKDRTIIKIPQDILKIMIKLRKKGAKYAIPNPDDIAKPMNSAKFGKLLKEIYGTTYQYIKQAFIVYVATNKISDEKKETISKSLNMDFGKFNERIPKRYFQLGQ